MVSAMRRTWRGRELAGGGAADVRCRAPPGSGARFGVPPRDAGDFGGRGIFPQKKSLTTQSEPTAYASSAFAYASSGQLPMRPAANCLCADMEGGRR